MLNRCGEREFAEPLVHRRDVDDRLLGIDLVDGAGHGRNERLRRLNRSHGERHYGSHLGRGT